MSEHREMGLPRRAPEKIPQNRGGCRRKRRHESGTTVQVVLAIALRLTSRTTACTRRKRGFLRTYTHEEGVPLLGTVVHRALFSTWSSLLLGGPSFTLRKSLAADDVSANPFLLLNAAHTSSTTLLPLPLPDREILSRSLHLAKFYFTR